jgi:predicted Zn-ribbon and HTH transcriptional regulator
MPRPSLEVADIFRAHGAAWRKANAGHLSLGQLKVMSAIERCRTAALGGHVARCEDCGHEHVAYNSCRNRHCPKCQGAAARDWLAARRAELLPVGYFHLVFTLTKQIAEIAYQNKTVVYGLLFKTSAEAMLTIAADPKHLGALIAITAVLHTWGSAMTHHPHLHMIVPGGGLASARGEEGASPTGTEKTERWVSCRPGFLLSVRVLSRLFRRLFLEKLVAAHEAGQLRFFNELQHLQDPKAFAGLLAPLRKAEWVVYAKRPFAGPEAVLAYLARYTHRVAISNRRLVSADQHGVTFKWKDYRLQGSARYTTMTLPTQEFIRRFLMHVLPKGFHRIRHYGLLANGQRAENLARARALLDRPGHDQATDTASPDQPDEPSPCPRPCPKCGGPMVVIETFGPEQTPLRPQARDPPAAKAEAA